MLPRQRLYLVDGAVGRQILGASRAIVSGGTSRWAGPVMPRTVRHQRLHNRAVRDTGGGDSVGASGWMYMVPYQDDLKTALDSLRRGSSPRASS